MRFVNNLITNSDAYVQTDKKVATEEDIQDLQNETSSAVKTVNGSDGVTTSRSGQTVTVSGVAATTNSVGVAKLHNAAACQSYTSDDGGATPLAILKALTGVNGGSYGTLTASFDATQSHPGRMSAADKTKLDKITDASQFLAAHPIGSIFITTSKNSPGSTYGGGWSQVSENYYLRSVLTTNTQIATYQGSNTHTLTVSEMPSHMHEMSKAPTTGIGGINDDGRTIQRGYAGEGTSGITDWTTIYNNTEYTGGGQAFDKSPASFYVCMWRRTS